MSLPLIAHAFYETLRISLPTIWEATRGAFSHQLGDQRLEQWSRRIVERARISLSVEGREHIVSGESYVVMSNHQSLYDIPILYQALRLRLRMVAKSELFNVPIWGRAMRNAGFIEIHRQDRERSRKALSGSVRLLSAGTSIWIAPEGTRSKSGQLGEFRKGGFYLALDSGCRILPVTINGTRAVLPAKSMRIESGCRVKVQIHPPIDPQPYGSDRRDELRDAVRTAIASALAL